MDGIVETFEPTISGPASPSAESEASVPSACSSSNEDGEYNPREDPRIELGNRRTLTSENLSALARRAYETESPRQWQHERDVRLEAELLKVKQSNSELKKRIKEQDEKHATLTATLNQFQADYNQLNTKLDLPVANQVAQAAQADKFCTIKAQDKEAQKLVGRLIDQQLADKRESKRENDELKVRMNSIETRQILRFREFEDAILRLQDALKKE